MTQVVPIRTSEEVVEKVDEVDDNEGEDADDNNNDSNQNETHHRIKSSKLNILIHASSRITNTYSFR